MLVRVFVNSSLSSNSMKLVNRIYIIRNYFGDRFKFYQMNLNDIDNTGEEFK